MPKGLYKRGATWWGRVKVRGAEHRRSLETQDQGTARRRVKAWWEQLRAAAIGDASHVFGTAAERWLEQHEVRPSTRTRYESSLLLLLEHFGSMTVGEIDRAAVAGYVAARAAVSAATIRRDLTVLSRILAWSVAAGWCQANPVTAYREARVLKEKRRPIEPPTMRAVQGVVVRAPFMAGRLLAFVLFTGMRLGEAVALTWDRVNLQDGEATLERTKTGARVVPLSPQALDVLQDLPRAGALVFWHTRQSKLRKVEGKGQPFRNAPTYMAKVIAKGGGAFRVHDLRHRFAVEHLRAHRDIHRLSQVLGHSTVRTTEVYLSLVGGTKSGTSAVRWDKETLAYQQVAGLAQG